MTTVRELSERLGVSKTAVLKYAKEELKLKTEPRKSLHTSANQCADGLQMCADEVVSLQIEKLLGEGGSR